MTPTTNYGEPWKAIGSSNQIWDSNSRHICDVSGSGTTFNQDASHAHRIVTTINACEGIEDPAAFMAAVRKLITSAAGMRKMVEDCDEDFGTIENVCEQAEKLLTPTPH